MGIDFTDSTQTVDAVGARHANIGYDGIGLFFAQEANASFDRIGGMDLIIGLQEHAQAFARSHFVINDENLWQIRINGHRYVAAIRAKAMPFSQRNLFLPNSRSRSTAHNKLLCRERCKHCEQ